MGKTVSSKLRESESATKEVVAHRAKLEKMLTASQADVATLEAQCKTLASESDEIHKKLTKEEATTKQLKAELASTKMALSIEEKKVADLQQRENKFTFESKQLRDQVKESH